MVDGQRREVAVRVADAEPVARFIGEACRAAALFAELDAGEVHRLPGRAARGILVLKQAVYELRGGDPAGLAGEAPRPPWPPGYETKDPNVTVRPAGQDGAAG